MTLETRNTIPLFLLKQLSRNKAKKKKKNPQHLFNIKVSYKIRYFIKSYNLVRFIKLMNCYNLIWILNVTFC